MRGKRLALVVNGGLAFVAMLGVWSLFTISFAGAADTGYLNPSSEQADSGGGGDGLEANPTNAFLNDGAFAGDHSHVLSADASCNDPGNDRHRYYDYGIDLPPGTTVQGIQLRVDARVANPGGSAFMCVELSWDGGSTWTQPRTTSMLTQDWAEFVLGGPTDTWGRTWSAPELSDQNLRARITNVSTRSGENFFLDWLAVRVLHSGPSQQPSETTSPTTAPTGTPTATQASTITPTPSPTQSVTLPTHTPTVGPPSCTDGYAMWAHGQDGQFQVDMSGSSNSVGGIIHSNNDFRISGSGNVITAPPEYVTDFDDTGSNSYPPEVQVPPSGTPPVAYAASDYAPGGPGADAAAGTNTVGMTAGDDAGDYHVRSGSYVLGQADAQSGGLFYVMGNVNVSGQEIGPRGITIVATGTIDISGPNEGFSAFIDELLLLSNRVDPSSGFIIKTSASNSEFTGNIAGLGGRIELSGSDSRYNSVIVGDRVTVNGSNLTIDFHASLCPTPTPTITPTHTPTPTSTPTITITPPTASPTQLPTATDTPVATPTSSSSPTATATPTVEPPTATATDTPTKTPTDKPPTHTATFTPTPTDTGPTPSPTATAAPTNTPTPTGTLPTATDTPMDTPTPTGTLPTATDTPTDTPTPTGTLPTVTDTPTPTGTLPTATDTPLDTETPTPTSATPTPTSSTPTATVTTPAPTGTPTPTPTSPAPTTTPTPTSSEPTSTPTATPTPPQPTVTPTSTPTDTATVAPTNSPTNTPTDAPTDAATETPAERPTSTPTQPGAATATAAASTATPTNGSAGTPTSRAPTSTPDGSSGDATPTEVSADETPDVPLATPGDEPPSTTSDGGPPTEPDLVLLLPPDFIPGGAQPPGSEPSAFDEAVMALRDLIRTSSPGEDEEAVRSATTHLQTIDALTATTENELLEPWVALGIVLTITAVFAGIAFVPWGTRS